MIRRRLIIVDSRYLLGSVLTAGLLLGVLATAGIGQTQDPKNPPPPGSTAAPSAPATPLPNPKQPTDNGSLPSPRSYGDRGTSSNVGNPPIRYPDRAPNADPVSYWKQRIISTGPGWGTTIIVIGASPCYVPYYYGYGFGYYEDARVAAYLSLGDLQLGYQPYRAGYLPNPQNSILAGRDALLERGRIAAEQRRAAQALRRQNSESRTAGSDENDYYLYAKPKPKGPLDKDPALAEAVADITAAFRSGEFARLEKHVNPADTLTLMAKGRSRKPLAAAAYLDMSHEAISTMKTTSYALDKVEPASNGAWMVYGIHTLRTEDGKDKAFNVGFVLKKHGETWMVAEVSADVAR